MTWQLGVTVSAAEDGGRARRQEIRRFLMARRAAIPPEAVGLPGGYRRRTPGLRREELASLAGIGVTWYTWLEQGRDIHVSAETLGRIAKALRLTPSDTAYLFSLAQPPAAEVTPTSDIADQGIGDTLRGFCAGPALLVGPCWDVEAFNELADLVFEFDNYRGPFSRNHIWRFFMDPVRRSKYPDWEKLAAIWVGGLRVARAKMLGDPYFESLLDALRNSSPEFRHLWNGQDTKPLSGLRIEMRLSDFGLVHFNSVRFRPVDAPQLLLHVLNPADDQTAEIMRKLSMHAEHTASNRPAG